MALEVSPKQIDTRDRWVATLAESASSFAATSRRTFEVLKREVDVEGYEQLLSHLRFCGVIPERYRHDSTEEKAYSKYTDSVIAEALTFIGLNAVVLDGRADMADVEAAAAGYDLVADAKAFRLTRTAKNQKDFKVAAMDRWRYSKEFAVVVAPIDQLPTRNSQIYLDASSRNVCVLSYSHLAAVVQSKVTIGEEFAVNLLRGLLAEPGLMNPSKDAQAYWRSLNRVLLGSASEMRDIWKVEKEANIAAVGVLKTEGLNYYSEERTSILRLSHQEALDRLLDSYKIDDKIAAIRRFAGNGLLDID